MSNEKRRVLVVDDEESMRITLAAVLEMEGFDIVEADNGERAIELLETQSFDLVLSDVRMPGLSGIDLFRRIQVQYPGTPVVLMTAFTREEYVDGVMKEGVFTVLSKPFDLDDAVQTLSRAISGPVVLVLDKEQDDAKATADALCEMSVRAMPAFDTKSAIEMVRSDTVDVCVAELGGGDSETLEFIDALRGVDPPVAIIAVSGYEIPEVMERVASGGTYAFMRKPLDIASLIRAIAQARGSTLNREAS